MTEEARPTWPMVAVLAMAGVLLMLAINHSRHDEAAEEAATAVNAPAAKAAPARSVGATRLPEAAPIPKPMTEEEAAEAEVAAHEEDGGGEVSAEDNPLAVLLDRGESLTAEAMQRPDMSTLDAKDDDYDAIDEAHQLFNPFEQTLRAAQPLTPEAWKAAMTEHKEDNGAVIARAGDLRRAGHPEEAGEMMMEWSRLYGLYQAQAYGRAPHPVPDH